MFGGHDNVRDLVDLWFGTQYRAIGPARFGYLGSAMPKGATVADQADAHAALLDHLELERVVMCGFSAGRLEGSRRRKYRIFSQDSSPPAPE